MKTYRIFAALALICLSTPSGYSQFYPDDPVRFPDRQEELAPEDQEPLSSEQIERQEEVFEEIETENKRLEEIKENAEQPGLRQHE